MKTVCYQFQPDEINARRLLGSTVWIYGSHLGVIIERNEQEYKYTIHEEASRTETIMDRKKSMGVIEKYRRRHI